MLNVEVSLLDFWNIRFPFLSDASKSTWIRNLFGTTSLRVKSPGYDGDSLMSSDTQRSLFPCMLGKIN